MITLKKLNEYKEKGLLKSQTHPTLPLSIWNYTPTVQYSQNWDDITKQCRGLVIDEESGEIVARPFSKFFNLEERKHIPTPEFEIYTKLDGSLGIVFNYKGEWVFASKGSFTSPHSQFLKSKMKEKYEEALRYMSPLNTYLFEIINPEFKIVVDYGLVKDVFLLASFNNKDGKECLDALDLFRPLLNVVQTHPGLSSKTLYDLKNLNTPNEEGFVIRFSNGERCKIKFSEYVKLHQIITGVSNLTIWRMLMSDEKFSDEVLETIPDEIYDWIKNTIEDLEGQFNIIERAHMTEVKRIRKMKLKTKKAIAMEIKRTASNNDMYDWLMFQLMNHKSYKHKLWKILKPNHERMWGIN